MLEKETETNFGTNIIRFVSSVDISFKREGYLEAWECYFICSTKEILPFVFVQVF